MSQITLYHNPRCSKSREALKLLQEKGVEPTIRLYLEQPLDQAELETLLSQLDLKPRDLLRTSEDTYKENNLKDESLTDAQLIQAIVDHPKLMQRPIAEKDGKAVIGRPPENVLALL